MHLAQTTHEAHSLRPASDLPLDWSIGVISRLIEQANEESAPAPKIPVNRNEDSPPGVNSKLSTALPSHGKSVVAPTREACL